MSFYPVQLNQVLAKIKQTVPVEIKETDPGFVLRHGGDAEWFLLESGTHEDYQPWALLQRNWRWIVGLHDKDFALIYVRHDPYKGLWLHHLPNEEYAPGCHQIASWSGPGDEGFVDGHH